MKLDTQAMIQYHEHPSSSNDDTHFAIQLYKDALLASFALHYAEVGKDINCCST